MRDFLLDFAGHIIILATNKGRMWTVIKNTALRPYLASAHLPV